MTTLIRGKQANNVACVDDHLMQTRRNEMRSFGFKHINAVSVVVAIITSLFLTVGSFAAEEEKGAVVQASGQRGETPAGMSGKTESSPISSPMESGTVTSPRKGTRGY